MTFFRFRAKHTNRISGKNLSWCRLLTGPYFEHEIHFHNVSIKITLGSLSTRDFDTRRGSGSELFSLITRLHTITFTMLSTFSRLWMISIKMCETPLSWHTECSLPVAVRVSKACVLKLPINSNTVTSQSEKRIDRPMPRPFPSVPIFLRKKPWERGCHFSHISSHLFHVRDLTFFKSR